MTQNPELVSAANIGTLVEMTGLPEDECLDMLLAHNGNLEQAVNAWLEGGENEDVLERSDDESEKKTTTLPSPVIKTVKTKCMSGSPFIPLL
jgi:hypothetical protein